MTQLPSLAGRVVTFQGDAHGQLHALAPPETPNGIVIQLGDLGLGFTPAREVEARVTARRDFWFLRGNHDAPDLCRQNPRYLGDFGRHEDLFWVGGAHSIDRALRTEGVSWWRDEELTAAQAQQAFDDYLAAKPRVMLSHDGPSFLFRRGGPMAIGDYAESATAKLLQAMLEAHAPDLWFFGHHHVSHCFQPAHTTFRCLAELKTSAIRFP